MLRPDGDEVVAVDWGFCGPAPVGADLADLVCGAGVVPATTSRPTTSRPSRRRTNDGYQDGFALGGLDGDPRRCPLRLRGRSRI